MKILPTNSAAVWIIAVGLTIATWLAVLTAKVPNAAPPSKAASHNAASQAQATAPTGTTAREPPVAYVNMNYDKPQPSPAP
jgi:type VI protein secretion system component VasK